MNRFVLVHRHWEDGSILSHCSSGKIYEKSMLIIGFEINSTSSKFAT